MPAVSIWMARNRARVAGVALLNRAVRLKALQFLGVVNRQLVHIMIVTIKPGMQPPE
jgi:hypothetical protein